MRQLGNSELIHYRRALARHQIIHNSEYDRLRSAVPQHCWDSNIGLFTLWS